jgi:hypothetical protein
MTLGPMRQLTQRGMQLKTALEARGIAVIETYPGAAQDIWGIPRQRDVIGLRRGLSRFRLQGLEQTERSPHVLDAVTCALVGRLYLEGNFSSLGSVDEALMILPPLSSPSLTSRTRPSHRDDTWQATTGTTAPEAAPQHVVNSRRAMAQDLVDMITTPGFEQFCFVERDRGGRVPYRLALPVHYAARQGSRYVQRSTHVLWFMQAVNDDAA